MTKKKFLFLLTFLLMPLAAFGWSNVNTSVPGTSQPLASNPIRSNFGTIKNELDQLRAFLPTTTTTTNSIATYFDTSGSLQNGKCTIDPLYGSYYCATSGSNPGLRLYHSGAGDIADMRNASSYGMNINQNGQTTLYAYNSPAVSISSAAGGANRDLKVGGSKNFEFWNGNMRRLEPAETFCLGTNPAPTNGCYPSTDTMTFGGNILPNSLASTWSVIGLQDFYFDMTNTGAGNVYGNVTGIRNYFRVTGSGANKTASRSSIRGIDNHVEIGTHIQGVDQATTLIAANKSEISFSGSGRAFSSGANNQPGVFLNFATITGVANSPVSRSSGSALFWGNYFGGDDNNYMNPITKLSTDTVVGYAFSGVVPESASEAALNHNYVKPIWVAGTTGRSFHAPSMTFGVSPTWSEETANEVVAGCSVGGRLGVCDRRDWAATLGTADTPAVTLENQQAGTNASATRLGMSIVNSGAFSGYDKGIDIQLANSDKAESYGITSNAAISIKDADGHGAQTVNRTDATSVSCSGASTYTLSGFIPAGSWVLGITVKPISLSGTLTSYSVGTGGDADKWGATIGNTTSTTAENFNLANVSDMLFTTATDVVITTNGGSCSSGSFAVALHRIYLTAPTS